MWDLSPLPATALPPPPRYWAFCSPSNVFIRKLGATESSREGLESEGASAGQRGRDGEKRRGRGVEEKKSVCFLVWFWIRGDLEISLSLCLSLSLSLSSSHSLFLSSASPAARQVSPWTAPSPPRLDSSCFWLATPRQVRDEAGRVIGGVTGQDRTGQRPHSWCPGLQEQMIYGSVQRKYRFCCRSCLFHTLCLRCIVQ